LTNDGRDHIEKMAETEGSFIEVVKIVVLISQQKAIKNLYKKSLIRLNL
jgi:hypothetical protein